MSGQILTREIMGGLALAILWVNTLLVAAAALQQAGEHRRRLRALRPLAPGSEGEGVVLGAVEGAPLARYELEQIGRAGAEEGKKRTIHFGDRTFAGASLGGIVKAGGAAIRVDAGEAEVWPAREDVLAAAACDDPARFDAVFEEARKARGHVRRVTVELGAGQEVWIAGDLRKEGGALVVRPSAALGVLVSAIDPRAWSRRAIAIACLFALAEIAVAAGVTALVLVPPVFDGLASKIGGALGLGFFLGVQPLGTMIRDAVRAPSKAFVRGKWIEAEARDARSAPLKPAST